MNTANTFPVTLKDKIDFARAEIATGNRERASSATKDAILTSLAEQGFAVGNRGVIADVSDKDAVRKLHKIAVERLIERARPGLVRFEDSLLTELAEGTQLNPDRIAPRMVQVMPYSHEERLFRWARLHWSIPTSPGYGRRLRFLVVDDTNGKLIGIIGLGDPVFSLGPRDRWIGWSTEQRKERLFHVLDAYVLGAVPPYSGLLAGKLIAALATSAEVSEAFDAKYGLRATVLTGRTRSGLALVTTSSALGRSSVYNRLDLGDGRILTSVGRTLGSGDFHFAGEVYDALREYAKTFCAATAKRPEWGNGFRNRREVTRRVLADVGLKERLRYHGVEREVFVGAPSENGRNFLCGHDDHLTSPTRTVNDISLAALDRWLRPRSSRVSAWQDFDPQAWRLWPTGPRGSKE